jgi:hypothetical protein
VGGVVIEAGLVAGYVIVWAMRKARRVGGRLDAETDGLIDGCLDRLHDVVAAKLDGHPVLQELEEEADVAASSDWQVSELTRQQMELALVAAARKDEEFGHAVMELVARLRKAEQAGAGTVISGSAVFTGDSHVEARDGGIAFGQIAGDVHVGRGQMGPLGPGRPGH